VRLITRTGIRLSRPARGEVAVFYGHRRLPAPGDPVEGGMVKFQRLQTTFPNRPRDFNLLYLGSSSLPADEQEVIRLAERRLAPIVVNQNGVAYPGWAGERTEELNARLRSVLEHADYVIFQSRFCQVAAHHFLGTWKGRPPSEILHNAVDTSVFTPAPEPPSGGPVILLGGDQTASYRLETALRTLALLPDARLLVTGTVFDSGRQLADELSLSGRVLFIGRFAQREAPSIYRRAHLLLHPKVNDPCPNVVLEALASGLPVVHSETGGTPELVGDAGIGVGSDTTWERDVPPAPELLAAAIEHVLSRLDELRGAARARAERFDLAPWVARHRALFEELLGL
jgi:glycosyltransferase involved in cell wall biosynthesis